MKSRIKLVITWMIIVGMTYLFLSLCNWNLSFKEWNGFSRFIIGVEGIFFLLNLLYES